MKMCKFSISHLLNNRPLIPPPFRTARRPAERTAPAPRSVLLYDVSCRIAGAEPQLLTGVAEVFDLGDGFGFRSESTGRDGRRHLVQGAVRGDVSFVVAAPENDLLHRRYFRPEFVPGDTTTRSFELSLCPLSPFSMRWPSETLAPLGTLIFSNRRIVNHVALASANQ